MKLTARHVFALVLLGIGVALWWTIGKHAGMTKLQMGVLILAAIVGAVPATRGQIARTLDRVRTPSPRVRSITALSVTLIAAAYLLFTAWYQSRDLFPRFHDEHMHLLQMRMLAHGRLWLPTHPLADFFETFHVMVRPVYASIYFPGTGLLLVPTAWLGLPAWVTPLMLAAGSVGLIYRVVAEMLDGVSGLLAALLLLSLQTLRFMSMVTMSHIAVVFLGLMIVWTFLKWRERRTLTWAAAMGAIAGWAAITRPIDAIAFAAPVAMAVLIELARLPRKRAGATILIAVIAAATFLSLQLVLDRGLTGNMLRMSNDLLKPGFSATEADIVPETKLPQKLAYYHEFIVPEVMRYRPDSMARLWLNERLPMLVNVTLPSALLVILVPLSLLGLRERWRWTLWTMLPLFVALYIAFPFFLIQYALVAAPAMLLAALIGARVLSDFAPAVGTFLTIALFGIALTSLPEISRVPDPVYERPTMQFVAQAMPGAVRAPAIVLFRYRPGDNFHEEPVYNVDVAWPDDAPIIRAHDLGIDRNRELFAYYAALQPQRTVYLYGRSSRTLALLGNVAELSLRFPVARPAEHRDYLGPSSAGPR